MSRRFVISDIHGCVKTLKELIENKIVLTRDDELYFLGDYIDRGTNSSGVLDYLIDLKAHKYNLTTLRGNHEENILETMMEYDAHAFKVFVAKFNKSGDLLNENGRVKEKYIDFFIELPYYIELDNCFLVHAGFDFQKPKPFKNHQAMLELRNTVIDNVYLKNKFVIHGHQVTHLKDIIKAINEKAQIIPLDNGCSYIKPHKIYDYTQTGNLCCLNIDTFELILQKNIDMNCEST